MNTTRYDRKILWRSGFTLLELLVVISIIGVLAGLMFPAAIRALEQGEKTDTEKTALNLKSAVSAYFTEYRKYPVRSEVEEEEILLSNHDLMDVLLGSDKEAGPGGLNPRQIGFYSGRRARPLGGGKYRRGIKLESGGAGELWDPYGEYYRLMLDLDFNNRVSAPDWDKLDSEELPESILVWSLAKEAEDDQDNIKTW